MLDCWFLIPPCEPFYSMVELSLPQMTAYLRGAGRKVAQRDLNQTFLHEKVNGAGYDMRRFAGVDAFPANYQLDAMALAAQKPHALYEDFFERHFLGDFRENPARVLGLSVIGSGQVLPSLILARLVKAEFPDTRVVLGGPWVTTGRDLLPEFLTAMPMIDGAVAFRGEEALATLFSALDGQADWGDIPNLTWRNGNEVQVNAIESGIPLTGLPLPDFKGLDLDVFQTQALPVMSCLGCYWGKCTFCHHHVRWPTLFQRTGADVVDMMEQMLPRYGRKRFIMAENATPPALMCEMADEIIRRELDVEWVTMTRAETAFTEEVCRKLYESGCRYLWVGLESSSEELLVKTRKGVTLGMMESMMRNCTAAGIKLILFIVDLPGFPAEVFSGTLKWLLDRADIFYQVLAQRFQLARDSHVFHDPELLGLRIAPEAYTSLDVYNLPFEGVFARSEDRFWQEVRQFEMDLGARRGYPTPHMLFWPEAENEGPKGWIRI